VSAGKQLEKTRRAQYKPLKLQRKLRDLFLESETVIWNAPNRPRGGDS